MMFTVEYKIRFQEELNRIYSDWINQLLYYK